MQFVFSEISIQKVENIAEKTKIIDICVLRIAGMLWVAYATHSTLRPVPTLPR
jgi:hypothetical protein